MSNHGFDQANFEVEDAAADAARAATKKLSRKQKKDFVTKVNKFKTNLLRDLLGKANKGKGFGKEL